MADPKISDIVNAVLTELRFGSGTDVQIHLQDGIIASINRLYRNMMRKYVWKDYFLTSSLTTVAATGQVPGSLSAIVTRFSNIIAVYNGQEARPLPVLPVMANPARTKAAGLMPTGDAKVFTIWPKQDRDIVVISRLFQEDDYTYDQEIPFYKDLLVLGAAMQLSIKAGTNDQLTKYLVNEFTELVETFRLNELGDYQVDMARGSIPTEWFEK